MQNSAYVHPQGLYNPEFVCLFFVSGQSCPRESEKERERRVLYYIPDCTRAYPCSYLCLFFFFYLFSSCYPTQSPSLVILYYFVSSCFNSRRRNGMDGRRSSRSLYKRVEKGLRLLFRMSPSRRLSALPFYFPRAICERKCRKGKASGRYQKSIEYYFFLHVLQLLLHYFFLAGDEGKACERRTQEIHRQGMIDIRHIDVCTTQIGLISGTCPASLQLNTKFTNHATIVFFVFP